MSKNLVILLFSSIIISACGGGGGGGGSSASPYGGTPAYSYDLIETNYTNKTWSTSGHMRRSDSSGVPLAFGGFSNSSGDYPLSISITEGSNYFDISMSGNLLASEYTSDTLNRNFSLTESSVNQLPLYNLDDIAVAALFNTTFNNANLYGVFLLPEGLNEIANIKYTNVGFLDFVFNNGERDTFAINYGSKTVSGDMPTSGSATYDVYSFLMLQAFVNGGSRYTSSSADIVSEGSGTLNANFSSGLIEGEITFSRYFPYVDFLRAGTTPNNQILDVPDLVVTMSEGNLNGSDFNGLASTNAGGFIGGGYFQGSFFGNNANETSGTFLLARDTDNDTSGADFWDIQGVFIGCKTSGC